MTAYFELTKPKIALLLLISTAAGMLAASGEVRSLPSLTIAIALLFGGYLCSGGAGAFNCYLDRDLDLVMRRTRNRPLPTGKLTPNKVLMFSIVISVISMPILWYVNPLVAGLSAIAWVYYVVIYSVFLKKRSDQNIVIGGAAGAFPPLIGWVAITGNIDIMAILLFLIVFFWTPPHAYALMLMLKEDYEKVNIPMLPVVRGELVTMRHSLIYSLILLAITIAPLPMNLAGVLYTAFAIPLGVIFVYLSIKLYMTMDLLWARRLFKYSTYYLAFLFVGLVFDKAIIF
jgi:protoheme IX farnesyltransferase